ncbi:adhesion G protein-coupled receptor L3-like [Branchiostoma floridae]|uniref:Adhesion G protein-coupled receptor L3-like n=1 Tax=Branchiostoma floridae TaxID=7739 RepID=A0A9J7MJT5_BRAFL|nr:adhesion G protein-coupled receptor L3-like [Branchiostoma floridae]
MKMTVSSGFVTGVFLLHVFCAQANGMGGSTGNQGWEICESERMKECQQQNKMHCHSCEDTTSSPTPVPPCSTNPCKNNGTVGYWSPGQSGKGCFWCDCPNGYNGDYCACPGLSDYVPFNGNSYLFSNASTDYAGAEGLCLKHDGRLIRVMNIETHEFLLNHILTCINQSVSFWIGLEDRLNEAVFVYSDGSTLGSFNRFYGGVDVANEDDSDCVLMATGLIPRWDCQPDFHDRININTVTIDQSYNINTFTNHQSYNINTFTNHQSYNINTFTNHQSYNINTFTNHQSYNINTFTNHQSYNINTFTNHQTTKSHSPSPVKPTATLSSSTTVTTAQSPATTQEITTQSSVVGSAKHCPSQVRRNINWPQTVQGSESMQRCPNDAIARWRCNEMGTWEGTPDVRNCVSSWLPNITEATGPAEDILSNLTDHLEREDNIYGGDISKTVSILGSLVEIQEQQLKNISQEMKDAVVTNFTTTMIRSVNALLRGSNVTEAAWSDIHMHHRSDVASGIMDSTEKTGILFARTVDNKTLSIVMDNIVMDVGTTSGGRSTFPELTNASSDWADVTDGITLPRSQHPVVAVLYNTLGRYLQANPTKRTVNSRVISATLVNRNSSNDVKVAGNVTIYLEHTKKTSNKSSCAFWNFNLRDWSDEGCTANIPDKTHTVCVCNHLTSFAILVDVTGQKHPFALSVITYIGCGISIVCLVFCICAFLGFRRVRCPRTIIHANLCICLLVAEVVFLAAVDKTENKIGCDVIAIILHYLFLAVFTWMCVEGVELYVLLVKVFNLKMNRLLYYHLVGYGTI